MHISRLINFPHFPDCGGQEELIRENSQCRSFGLVEAFKAKEGKNKTVAKALVTRKASEKLEKVLKIWQRLENTSQAVCPRLFL